MASGNHKVAKKKDLRKKKKRHHKLTEEEKLAKAQEDDRKFYEEEERKASQKIALKLISKEKLEGTDIKTFKINREALDYAAGQFAYFRLEGVTGDPKGPIRHFTIASSPTEHDYILISTRIRNTPYKQKLSSLAEGTNITAWGPQGEFVLEENSAAIFLSGGIGVTPFRSLIKYATDKNLPTKIVMFDSNRDEQNILYKKEFDEWAAKNKNLRIIYALSDDIPSGWTGEKGRIDRAMIKRHVEGSTLNESIFYICGPPGMLRSMQEILQKDLKIPKKRIKVEEFTGY